MRGLKVRDNPLVFSASRFFCSAVFTLVCGAYTVLCLHAEKIVLPARSGRAVAGPELENEPLSFWLTLSIPVLFGLVCLFTVVKDWFLLRRGMDGDTGVVLNDPDAPVVLRRMSFTETKPVTSAEDLPPELRAQFAALRRDTRPTMSRIVVKDPASGRQQVYNSLDEAPPEVRRLVEQMRAAAKDGKQPVISPE